MIILFTVSEFIFTPLIKYPKMVVSGLNTLKNFFERQAAIMEDKQVMNRQTSSKELHLVSCGWEKCTPSQSYGPGVRRYYTIHFVLKGQGYFYINNRKYSLKAGQCFSSHLRSAHFIKQSRQIPGLISGSVLTANRLPLFPDTATSPSRSQSSSLPRFAPTKKRS